MMMRALVVGAVVFTAAGSAVQAQDVAAGESSFRKCQVRHDVGEEARTKLGPALNGLDGRKAGTSDFSYSDGMKSSGFTWNDETFHDYIKDPRGKIADTRMMFVGIKDDKEIGDLWAYLKQFGPDGKKK
jgi:cytochrome c